MIRVLQRCKGQAWRDWRILCISSSAGSKIFQTLRYFLVIYNSIPMLFILPVFMLSSSALGGLVDVLLALTAPHSVSADVAKRGTHKAGLAAGVGAHAAGAGVQRVPGAPLCILIPATL